MVDTGEIEGSIVVDKIRGPVAVVGIGTGPGAGAGVVAVSPGERAELSVLETQAKSTDACFWLSRTRREKHGGEEERVRARREPRAYGSSQDEGRTVGLFEVHSVFVPITSNQDDGPAVMGIGPCVDSITGDPGVAFRRSGTSVRTTCPRPSWAI